MRERLGLVSERGKRAEVVIAMRERPGAFSAASSSADFTCADATATSCSMAMGSVAPLSVSGISPPSRAS